jgi:hypothetical protein
MSKKIDYNSMSDLEFLRLKTKYQNRIMRLMKVKTVLLFVLLGSQVLLLILIVLHRQAEPH